jgi:hypothetical protein
VIYKTIKFVFLLPLYAVFALMWLGIMPLLMAGMAYGAFKELIKLLA